MTVLHALAALACFLVGFLSILSGLRHHRRLDKPVVHFFVRLLLAPVCVLVAYGTPADGEWWWFYVMPAIATFIYLLAIYNDSHSRWHASGTHQH